MKKIYLSILLISITGCGSQQQAKQFTLGFTGDILMHEDVKRSASRYANTISAEMASEQNGFDHLFLPVKPLLEKPDLMCGNLEFPVAPPYVQSGFRFNCPPDVLPALRRSGFDLFSLGNNHMLDQGVNGTLHTLAFLENHGLRGTGAAATNKRARKGLVLEVNGARIGFISYTELMNFAPPESGVYINMLTDRERVLADIYDIRDRCDYLVLLMHAGAEYTMQSMPHLRTFARQACDAGVDLVIGHHPHMLQDCESYLTLDGRRCPIFYSLGNFICDQRRRLPYAPGKLLHIRDSAVVMAQVSFDNQGQPETRIEITPTHTLHHFERENGREYKKIFTVSIPSRLKELNEKIASAEKPEQQSLKEEAAFLTQEMTAIREVLFRYGTPANMTFLEKE